MVFLACARWARSGPHAHRSSGRAASSTASSQVEPTVLITVGGYPTATRRSTSRAEVTRDPRRGCRRCATSSASATGHYAVTRRAAVGRTPGRPGARRVRPRALRPPAVRAVLLGHHRAAEGHRARPRRDPARAPQDVRPSTSTSAPAMARCGSPPPRGRCGTSGCPRCCREPTLVVLDGNPLFPDLRRSGGSRPSGRRAPRHQPRIPDVLPRSRDRARSRPRTSPSCATLGTPARRCRRRRSTGSTSSSAPACSSTRSAAARTCAAGSWRAARGSRCTAGEMSGPCLGLDVAAFDAEGNGRRGGRRAGGPRADAVDAGRVLERRRRRALPRAPTSTPTPASGATATGSRFTDTRQLRDHRALGRDAEPRRRAARHRRVLRRRRGHARGRRLAGRPPGGRRRAARASCCCSSRSADGAELDDDLRARIAPSCAGSSPRGTCPT